jgi:hypothetical protein
LEAAGAAAVRVAVRPGSRSAEEARAAAEGDEAFPTGPRFRDDPDFAGNRQQALARQIFGDSPMSQSWERFVQVYGRIDRTRPTETAPNSAAGDHLATTPRGRNRVGGAVTSSRPSEWTRLEGVFRRWIEGRYVGENAPLGRYHPDAPMIYAVPGKRVVFNEPGTQEPVRLLATDQVTVKDPKVPGETRTMTVTEAEAERRDLVDQRVILEARYANSTDVEERRTLLKGKKDIDGIDGIEALNTKISNVSEGMGEAAGLRYAATFPGGLAYATVGRGSGVVDIIHIDPNSQPIPGRVTVIECKGAGAGLGSRRVELLGRAARAEQTTAQNLRAVAQDMIKNEKTLDNGRALLKALDSGNIEVVVVRQPVDADSNRGSIEVTDYPVGTTGRF